MTRTRQVTRPDGRLAHELVGPAAGPLVVCSPGLGDLRSTFSRLAGDLAEAGARVVTVDLRGQGESSTGWPSYRGEDVADDLLAVVEAYGGPAVIVGSSFSAGAAVVAAARRPEAVAGLVLSGPFVREVRPGRGQRLGARLFDLPGLGRRLWPAFWQRLFVTRPADFAERRAALAANLGEPGRYDAVRGMLRAGHAAADRALADVTAPALVVMGSGDPDFPDPAAEAAVIADRLGGRTDVLLVEEAGHYPHAERPDLVSPAVVAFVREVACRARD